MIRRFEVNISCASCANKIEKVFSKYKDIKLDINIMEKILVIYADENKYSSEKILEIIKQSGYEGEEL